MGSASWRSASDQPLMQRLGSNRKRSRKNFCSLSSNIYQRGHYLYEQDEAERLLAGFPPVDVFIAHNSPRNMHERDTEVHVGFEAFNRYIERAQPRIFIHGHQHVNQDTLVGRTQVMGVFGQRRIQI